MKIKQYIVDAFTDKVFGGNPAAVCIMQNWISDELMQAIAIENNLSETAFAVKEGNSYHLRWFTPGGEIDLCGHATLATAFVITNYYEPEADKVVFSTMSGELTVVRKSKLYEMKFPAYKLREITVTAEMAEAIGVMPQEAYIGRDMLCIVDSAEVVKNLKPDLQKVHALDGVLLHVTAEGNDDTYDCVSRSFAPKLAIDEDPVCGSGHCHIVPYWADKLNKNEITAYQASERGGTLYCRMDGDKVFLAGYAVLYSEAEIYIE